MALLFISSNSIFAQPIQQNGMAPGSDYGLIYNLGGNGAPINGGLSILIIIGIIYGVKKYISIFHKSNYNKPSLQ